MYRRDKKYKEVNIYKVVKHFHIAVISEMRTLAVSSDFEFAGSSQCMDPKYTNSYHHLIILRNQSEKLTSKLYDSYNLEFLV